MTAPVPSSPARRWLSILIVGAALASPGCGTNDGALVLQDTPAAQATYEHHARGWLQWVMAQPWSNGPVNDSTGDACGNEQSGDVWYLAGTPGGPVERDCEVPAGKALFFPLVNRWLTVPDGEATDEELAGYLLFAQDWFPDSRAATCALTLTLDGKPYLDTLEEHDEALYVVQLEPFSVKVDDDNWTEGVYEGGPASFSLTDGHFALLSPPSPGPHTLEFSAALCDEAGDVYFETSATYNLDVAP